MGYVSLGFISADGRYYTRKLTLTTGRYPIMVLRCAQSVGYAPVGGSVNNRNGENYIFFSDPTVTWDVGTSVITVDNGVNAWAAPIILFPKGFIA